MFVLLVALNVAHSKHNARCDLVAGITASAAPLATCAHACAAAGSGSGLGIGFFFFGFAASPARLLHLVAAFVEEADSTLHGLEGTIWQAQVTNEESGHVTTIGQM